VRRTDVDLPGAALLRSKCMGLCGRGDGGGAFGLVLGALLLLLPLSTQRAAAEDDGPLLRMLSQAQSFRVRARAALALAHAGDERAIGALEAALRDAHAAVRAAAAAALGEIGTRRCVPALREAAADPSLTVAEQAKGALRAIAAREVLARAGTLGPDSAAQPRAEQNAASLSHVRYAVVLGEMRNQSDAQAGELSDFLGERVAQELSKLDQVAVFSLAEMTDAIGQELTRRKVPTFRLEGNLSRLTGGGEADQYRVRCEVSLLLMDEPERTLRGLMKGAATSSQQPRGAAAAEQELLAHKTLQSAVHSALSNARQAIEAAAIRRDLGQGDIRAEASLGGRASRGR
jgi:hypothetical protein